MCQFSPKRVSGWLVCLCWLVFFGWLVDLGWLIGWLVFFGWLVDLGRLIGWLVWLVGWFWMPSDLFPPHGQSGKKNLCKHLASLSAR